VALGTFLVALEIKLLVSPTLGEDTPFLLFFVTVAFSAWYGGAGPGVMALLLSAAASNWYFLRPAHTLHLHGRQLLRLSVFFSEGSLLIFLSLALRRAREAAEQSAARAQEALRLREEFLAVASHELKTPITSLHLDMEMIRRMLGAPEVELRTGLRPRLERMVRQTGRLTALVNSLLDVSRLSSGRLELQRTEVELGELVHEVAERLSPEAARAGCALQVEIREPARGQWDRLRLEQVVTNLLGNALKYGAGAPVELRVEAGDGQARLVVRDHGIGIPREAQERIFQRFERAVPSHHFGGLGLGLYIVRYIIEAHGGTIGVESTPGQGSTFTVTLPLAPDAGA
jgi:signal transduction histidine kinase